ncbi:MAG: lipopolysaccharide heptosyltransferase II [Calditrichaeota bacterium]|nr:MAG: lipopolysaccharide heptosyltransferase II [Calditrichota bacterium]
MALSYRRILVVQTAFVGDVILSLPLVQEAARIAPPGAEIDLLTLPRWQNLLETHPSISTLWLYDKHGQERGVGAFWRLCRGLRRRRYQLALVPHRSLRSALLVWLAGIPRRIGFDRSPGRFLFTEAVPYRQHWHEARRNLSLLEPLGYRHRALVRPQIAFTAADEQAVAGWLSRKGVGKERPLVVLAPGSVWATKRWPGERFADLARKLAQSGFAVALVGGKEDRALCDAIVRRAGGFAFNGAGRLTLRQSACLIARARLLVGNDSAPVHLAWAVGTPVVALFGPTVPEFGFFPPGPEDKIVQRSELACRPCNRHGPARCPLKNHRCMKDIPLEQVWPVVADCLQVPTHPQEGGVVR